MNEIIVLTRDELQEIIRQAVALASKDLIKMIETPITSEIMTKNELAKYLRCDRTKIDRLMKKDLPFVRLGDVPRFYKSQIDEWLNCR